MPEKMSILNNIQDIDLDNNRDDYKSMLVKSLVGALPYIPYIGPLTGELIASRIQNQRLDRIKLFVEVLNQKVSHIEEDLLKTKMVSQEFTDLFEDGVLQAAKAASDERRGYIASLLKNGITEEALETTGKKKLLRLLGELNDAEIIVLQYYALNSEQQRDLSEKHSTLFMPIIRAFGSPQENFDKGAIRDSYKDRLIELGLLKPTYKRVKKGEIPEFDEKTGGLKISSHNTTPLGKLLLRYIDLDQTTESPEQSDGD